MLIIRCGLVSFVMMLRDWLSVHQCSSSFFFAVCSLLKQIYFLLFPLVLPTEFKRAHYKVSTVIKVNIFTQRLHLLTWDLCIVHFFFGVCSESQKQATVCPLRAWNQLLSVWLSIDTTSANRNGPWGASASTKVTSAFCLNGQNP